MVEHRGDFLTGSGRRELERLVDVDITLGDAPRGVTEKRGDRQLGETQVTGHAAKGVTKGMRRNASDFRRAAQPSEAAIRRGEVAISYI